MATTTWTSTNGRWGAQLVHPDGQKFPAQGTLRSLGRAGGLDCFEFAPAETGTWIVTGDDLSPVAGCEVAYNASLQSSSSVTFLVARPGAIWKRHGYKGRSVTVVMLRPDGTVVRPDPATLLASGAIEPAAELHRVGECLGAMLEAVRDALMQQA